LTHFSLFPAAGAPSLTQLDTKTAPNKQFARRVKVCNISTLNLVKFIRLIITLLILQKKYP